MKAFDEGKCFFGIPISILIIFHCNRTRPDTCLSFVNIFTTVLAEGYSTRINLCLVDAY